MIGKECFKFIDYLKARGDKYWQILPLNPVDHEGSPYAGSSAFAGNARLLPYTEEELHELYDKFNAEQDERIENDASKFGKAGIIEDDSDKNTKGKAACDAEALANIGMTRDIKREYEKFIYENAKWLDSYAMYQAIRKRMQGKPCREWEEQYRTYKASLWNDEGLKAEAEYYRFEQYIFETEWLKVRTYAREQGISIIGDMPIYVSEESADVWEHPEFFNTDEEAGVPPDYFSEEGQSWGNPLYRWDILKKDGFGWWMRRFKRAFKLYDAVRLDHFRGFEAYWAIPRGEKAVRGHWMQGPGAELFEAAYRQFGALPIIAEDLGFLTPGVRMLMANAGFPGMDVMQFSDIDPLDYYSPDCDRVSYTGTHDNETLLGWCKSHYKEKIDKILRQKNIVPENINYEASANLKYAASENEDCMTAEDKKYAAAYDTEARVLADRLLSRFYDTDAFIKIVPLQDILGLDNAARMNTPGTLGINWRWQAKEEDLYDADTI